MKKLFRFILILGLTAVVVISIFLFLSNKELREQISSRPEIQEMVPNKDYKFLNVFESNGHRFALVAKMRIGDEHDPPIVIKVDDKFPLTGSGFEQTFGFQNQVGEIKTLW